MRLAWLACVGCYTSSPPAAPVAARPTSDLRRVQIDLDNEDSLTRLGFRRLVGDRSTWGGGVLNMILDGSVEEWSQERGFADEAGRGSWAVEARLSITRPCASGGTGVWIGTYSEFVRLEPTAHELLVGKQHVEIGSTRPMRTYRVDMNEGVLTVRVDGRVVLTTPPTEHGGSVGLMFGTFTQACPQAGSSWDYIAYETKPTRVTVWPTTGSLLALYRPVLPGIDAVEGDAPCLAMLALDGAVRDLLPAAYLAERKHVIADELSALGPLTSREAIETARHTLDSWTVPDEMARRRRSDFHEWPPARALNTFKPHAPTIASVIHSALEAARSWRVNPSYAVRSTELALQAYTDAVAAQVPGATEALQRLREKVDALATEPLRCGL